MTIKNGAALSINIKIHNDCRITIKNAYGTVEVESELSQIQLKSMHKKLREDLENFRTELAAVKQYSLKHVIGRLLKLQRRGGLVLLELFKFDLDGLVQTVNMCKRACPNWAQPGFDPASLSPALISVRTILGSGIPVEMLPLFELETPEECKGDLGRIAASFLSFSAIVKRDIGVSPPDTDRLLATPRLPVKPFLYRRLPGIDEVNDFLQHSTLIDLDVA
jgi:hypothetical protein